jgi:hypothetical protein
MRRTIANDPNSDEAQLKRLARVKHTAPAPVPALGPELISFFKNSVQKRQTKLAKIAAFCSWGGSTSAENCCTKPTVTPPQNAPKMLPMPPSTTPEYMMMT